MLEQCATVGVQFVQMLFLGVILGLVVFIAFFKRY